MNVFECKRGRIVMQQSAKLLYAGASPVAYSKVFEKCIGSLTGQNTRLSIWMMRVRIPSDAPKFIDVNAKSRATILSR
jgi:hypothetical protein